MVREFFTDESAQGMTEYILIIFLIALAAYLIIKTYGKAILGKFIGAGNTVESSWGD